MRKELSFNRKSTHDTKNDKTLIEYGANKVSEFLCSIELESLMEDIYTNIYEQSENKLWFINNVNLLDQIVPKVKTTAARY